MSDRQTYKEMIVQSTSAKRMIETVSPIYEDAYVGCWLFEDIGREWDRLWKIIDKLPDQLFPQLASWLLYLWEERYGITPNIGDDDETRRIRNMEAEAPPKPFTPFTLNQWVYANCRRQALVEDHVGPYTFGVYVVNHPDSLPLDYSKLYKYIVQHKHSHMSFELRLESDSTITIGTATMYWRFTRTLCGTSPYRNYEGGVDHSKVKIGSHFAGYGFDYPMAGTGDTGKLPQTNIEGVVERSEIEIEAHGAGTQFHYPMSGTDDTGTYPQTNVTSDIERSQLTASGDGAGYRHGYIPCGAMNSGGGIL